MGENAAMLASCHALVKHVAHRYRRRMRLRPANALVSCEHASNRVPARYRDLGLAPARMRAHIAWDPGAAALARMIAKRLRCPCHLGRWSRLVVDLNRSLGHEKLIASTSFGIAVPGNADLSPAEHDRRVRLYHRPYRDAATADVERIIARSGVCVHWSMHSFTPVVDGVVRAADVGLLYDPARRRERELAHALRPLIAAHGLRVRMNYPYRGTSDGFTTQLRARLPAIRYLAFEIEANQALLRTPAAVRRLGRILTDAIATLHGQPGAGRRPS
jgi:predicted N-formylglutamate amidohydrolase